MLRVWNSRVENRRGRESGCLARDYRDEVDAALERFAIAPFTLA